MDHGQYKPVFVSLMIPVLTVVFALLWNMYMCWYVKKCYFCLEFKCLFWTYC